MWPNTFFRAFMYNIQYIQQLYKMGQQVPGTKEIKYKTKDGIPICYIFYDLKGKNRFPTQPNNEAKINAMFEMALSEIDAHPDQIAEIKGFNSKYKYRFTVMHKRKLQQQNVRNSLTLTAASTAFVMENQAMLEAENKSEGKRIKLEEKLKEIQQSKSSLKMSLNALDKLIGDQKSHYEFIEIEGIKRILVVLQKEIKLNLEGYKTNFGNQIDLLRFIKAFSSHHPKEFYCDIENKPEYGNIILKTFHPVCTPVTAYCLSLMQDYIWRAEDCKSILVILKEYSKKQNYSSFLTVFTETLQTTNNILMVFYILKFMNEVIAGTVEENDRSMLKAELNETKYSFVIEAIKMRLQQYFYKVEHCTFIHVSQQIFKFASKGKKQYQNSIYNPETIVRNTLSMKDLQQQLVMSFFDLGQAKDQPEKEAEENEDEFMIVYLSQSGTKEFNRVILDVVSQIRSYYKLQAYMMVSGNEEEQVDQQKQKQVVGSKLEDLKQEEYLKYIRSNSIKNDCTTEMLNILKNFQYLDKNQIKKLDNIILEEMGTIKKGPSDQSETLKKTLKEKQDLIKKILKENIDLKSQVAAKAKMVDQIKQNSSGSTFPQLPTPPTLSNKQSSSSQILPPPPSLSNISSLPPPPSLGSGAALLPPPPSLSTSLSQTSSNVPQIGILPPPPSLSTTLSELPPPPSLSTNLGSLPPPPYLGTTFANLPPPPSLGATLSNLPPPPSLSSTLNNLPPPPSLSSTLSTLPPPPPSLTSTLSNLPPPPSLSTTLGSLPSPPSLGSTILPPPPSLSATFGDLPPPPSLGSTLGSLAPPPPSLGTTLGNLPPPPPSFGNLPPPPSFGNLPPPPSLGGTLGSLPPPPSFGGSLPALPTMGMPVFNVPTEKLKEKRKPAVPLKNCNYAVLTHDKIKGTVWQQVNDEKIAIDTSEIQSLFCKKVEEPKALKTQSLIKLPSEQKKQPVKLIGGEKWRNVEIVLTKLKIPKGQLAKCLIQCSGKYADPIILESIKNILPTQDEEEMIKMYGGDPNDLGRPETFYRELITVPEYSHRIKSIIFASVKDDIYFQTSQKMQQLLDGFNSLQNNYRFHHILEVTLAVGNYLNGTSLKGGAWGFKLDSLERLQQVKSADGKMNAAYYVIKQVWKKFEYPLFSKEQIDLYSYLSKMPVSQISSDIGELRKNLASLRKSEKSNTPNSNDAIGKFCEEMRNQLQLKIQQYSDTLKQLEEAYSKCAAFYCEDSKKMQSDEFGKKIFKSIHFLFESERVYKVVIDKQKKQDERRAVKSQIKFNESPTKEEEPFKITKSAIIQPTGLPEPPKLVPKPVEPIKQPSKQEKLKEYEKAQQKAHEDFIKKRQTKVIAYRNSKAPKGPGGLKNDFDQISFLKGIK